MSTSPFPRMHVNLYVSNIEATIKFYNTLFGQEPLKVKPNYAKYILQSPSLIISFVENPERVQQNFGHLGFEVATKEDMMKKMEELTLKGLNLKQEMGTSCCYALQDKFWATDPDGVQWEVYFFHADSEFNDPHYEEASAAACCMPPTAEKKKISLKDLTA